MPHVSETASDTCSLRGRARAPWKVVDRRGDRVVGREGRGKDADASDGAAKERQARRFVPTVDLAGREGGWERLAHHPFRRNDSSMRSAVDAFVRPSLLATRTCLSCGSVARPSTPRCEGSRLVEIPVVSKNIAQHALDRQGRTATSSRRPPSSSSSRMGGRDEDVCLRPSPVSRALLRRVERTAHVGRRTSRRRFGLFLPWMDHFRFSLHYNG